MTPKIPAWLPPTLFAALTLILFRDFVFSREMLFGSDTEAMGYMARLFYARELASGHVPGWNPLLLGGTPFLASLAGGDSLYPPSALLLLIMEPYRALGWKLVLHVFLAGLGMYGFSRSLGASRAGATVAGTAFLVAPFLVTLVWPGHDGKLFVTALAPFLFWGIEAWFRRGTGTAWAGIAAVVALVTLTTHFQMAYFLFGAAGVYAIALTIGALRRDRAAGEASEPDADTGEAAPTSGEAGRGRRPSTSLVRFALFLAASVTGVAAAGVQFLPAAEYITEFSRRTATTTRAAPEENRQYASSWSMHPEEAMSLVVPEFVGSNTNGADWTTGTYWGRNPFKLNHEYIGLGALLLALLAFLGGPRPLERWTLLGIGTVAFLYTLGVHTPVWGTLYAVLPGIRLFRAPSMAIFLSGVSVCALASLGVDRILAWIRNPESREAVLGQRVLWIAAGAVGLILLLAAAGPLFDLWSSVVYRGMEPGAAAALDRARPFVVRGALLAVLVAGSAGLVLFFGRKGSLPASAAVAVLVVVVAADGMRVSDAFVETRDFDRFAAPGPNIQALEGLEASQEPFRVLDLNQGGQSVRPAMFGIELASGHHPNDLARYRELTGMEGSGAPVNLLRSPNVLGILNVRYLIWPVQTMGPPPEGFEPVSATQTSDGRLYEAVFEVPTLPRARLVAQAEVVRDEEAVERLLDPTFDVATTVTIPTPLPMALDGGVPEGRVEWLLRSTDRQELRVTTDRRSLLVVADNWYPAWHATVDGSDVPIHRVDHTLRGIVVEPGTHTVILTFRSGPVRQGLLLSGVGVLTLLGVAGASVARRRRREPPEPA